MQSELDQTIDCPVCGIEQADSSSAEARMYDLLVDLGMKRVDDMIRHRPLLEQRYCWNKVWKLGSEPIRYCSRSILEYVGLQSGLLLRFEKNSLACYFETGVRA